MENNSTTTKTKKQVFLEYVCVVLWLTPVVLGVYLFIESLSYEVSPIIWNKDADVRFMLAEIRNLITRASDSIIAILTVFLFCIGLLVIIRTKALYKDE